MMKTQKGQCNIFSALSVSEIPMRKAVSFSLAFCFMFILSGLDIILAHAFTVESSAKSHHEENNMVKDKKTDIKLEVGTDQYADLWQIAKLDCFSESLSNIPLDNISIAPDKNFYFFKETALKPKKDKLFNVPDKNLTVKSNKTENNQVISLNVNFVSEAENYLLPNQQSIALVGPVAMPQTDEYIEDTLICNVEQQSQLQLVLKQENRLLITSLPEYLQKAINGGLSKARWQSSCPNPITQTAVSIQMKKFEINLDKKCNEVLNNNIYVENAYYKNAVYRLLKSPVMSTGPPTASEKDLKTITSCDHQTSKSEEQKKSYQAVKGIKSLNHNVQYSLSYTDNVKNIKKITG